MQSYTNRDIGTVRLSVRHTPVLWQNGWTYRRSSYTTRIATSLRTEHGGGMNSKSYSAWGVSSRHAF